MSRHELDVEDLARMSALIRGGVDFDGFRSWYDGLSVPGQRQLTCWLCAFAHAAGLTEARFDEAVDRAGLARGDPLVRQARALTRDRRDRYGDLADFCEWVGRLPDPERAFVFRLCAYLFGIAEGRLYRGEAEEPAARGWHRDRLDD